MDDMNQETDKSFKELVRKAVSHRIAFEKGVERVFVEVGDALNEVFSEYKLPFKAIVDSKNVTIGFSNGEIYLLLSRGKNVVIGGGIWDKAEYYSGENIEEVRQFIVDFLNKNCLVSFLLSLRFKE